MNALNAQQVYITTRLDTDTSFGVRVDNGEQVFINAKLVRDKDLDAGDTRKLILTPNPSGKSDTPWQAIGISIEDTVPEKPTPRVEEAKLEDRIMDLLSMWRTMSMPSPLRHWPRTWVSPKPRCSWPLVACTTLGRWPRRRSIAKGGQDKASWVLWAPSADWFAW